MAPYVSCASAARRSLLRFRRAQILHPSVYALMSPPQPLQIFRGPGIPLGSPMRSQESLRWPQLWHPRFLIKYGPPHMRQVSGSGGRNARLSPARRHALCLLEQILHPRVRSSIGAPQPVHVLITIPFPRRGGSSQSWRLAYAAGSASPRWGNNPGTSYGERGALTHAPAPYPATTA